MTFGDRLRLARENAGYGQAELGMACGWGEGAQPRVSQYEGGTREPILADIEKMASVLGASPEEIAFGSTGLRPEEQELLQAWRLADGDAKLAFRGLVLTILKKKKPRKGGEPKLKAISPVGTSARG
jgi:transcriptional regulator with XRE-family HTH domain